MNRNKNLKFSLWMLSVLITFLTAVLIVLNILNINLDSRLSNFLSGFALGIGIVFVGLLIVLSSKRVRAGFEVAVNDERNRMIKQKTLTLSFKISMLLFLFLGLILWALNYSMGPVLVVTAVLQANIGLICWGILNKLS